MPDPRFVHLRLHTEYSIVDGMARVGDTMAAAAADGMPAVAITNVGNLFGAVKFYLAARSAGIQPAIGCDLAITNEKNRDQPFRIVALCRDGAEAIRQFRLDVGRSNAIFVHLTLVPYIAASGELKTKPTQHSVKQLQQIGIQPDILLCRTDRLLSPEIKAKIALFCNVDKDAVITAKNVETVYEVPILFHHEGLDEKIVEKLNIWTGRPNLKGWERVVKRIKHPHFETTIAVAGKYVSLVESYKSLTEALIHGGIANDAKVNLKYIDSGFRYSAQTLSQARVNSNEASSGW